MSKPTSFAIATIGLVVVAAILWYELEAWAFEDFHDGSPPAMVSRTVTYTSALLVVLLAYFCGKTTSTRRLAGGVALAAAAAVFAGAIVTVGFNASEGVVTVKWAGAIVRVETLSGPNDFNYCLRTFAGHLELADDARKVRLSLFVGPELTLLGRSSLDSAFTPFRRCSLQ